jgi:hypothetical protein
MYPIWVCRQSCNADVRPSSASVNRYKLASTLNLFGARVCFGADVAGMGKKKEPGLQLSQHRRDSVTVQRVQFLLEHSSDGSAGRFEAVRVSHGQQDPRPMEQEQQTWPIPKELIRYLASTDPPQSRVDVRVHRSYLIVLLMTWFHNN